MIRLLVLKAHVAAHWRHVSGRPILVHDYDDRRMRRMQVDPDQGSLFSFAAPPEAAPVAQVAQAEPPPMPAPEPVAAPAPAVEPPDVDEQNVEQRSEPFPREFTVKPRGFDKLTAKIDGLAARAKRLGVEPPRVEVLREWSEPIDPEFPEVTHKLREVRVVGDWPLESNGWHFLAALRHTEHGNIIKRSPWADKAITVPEFHRASRPNCSHCATDRKRKTTYLLAGPEGQIKQVGGDCLQNYLPAGSIEGLCELAASMGDVIAEAMGDDESGGGGDGDDFGNGNKLIDTKAFVAEVARVVREHGFISRKNSDVFTGKTATADHALMAMLDRAKNRDMRDRPTDADRETAEQVMAWARGLTPASDYEHNLKVAALQPDVGEHRTAALLASAVPAYNRAMGVERQRKAAAEAGWLPGAKAGDKIEVTAQLLDSSIHDGNYGESRRHRLVTPEGHYLTWWGTGNQMRDMEDGGTYRIKASVKALDEYKGAKLTTLTRVKILDRMDAPHLTGAQRAARPAPISDEEREWLKTQPESERAEALAYYAEQQAPYVTIEEEWRARRAKDKIVKAVVPAHWRTTPTGGRVYVSGYADRRPAARTSAAESFKELPGQLNIFGHEAVPDWERFAAQQRAAAPAGKPKPPAENTVDPAQASLFGHATPPAAPPPPPPQPRPSVPGAQVREQLRRFYALAAPGGKPRRVLGAGVDRHRWLVQADPDGVAWHRSDAIASDIASGKLEHRPSDG